MSRSGSQFKSFIFNVSPTEHASCRAGSARRPELGITHPYPNLPVHRRRGPPRIPPVRRHISVEKRARPLRRSPGLVPALVRAPGIPPIVPIGLWSTSRIVRIDSSYAASRSRHSSHTSRCSPTDSGRRPRPVARPARRPLPPHRLQRVQVSRGRRCFAATENSSRSSNRTD